MADENDGRPTVTGTEHELPFEKLSPRDFERLCHALLIEMGYQRVEHYGAAGGERGRDIVMAAPDGRRWVVQCKRVKACRPGLLLGEIEKIGGLIEAEPAPAPTGPAPFWSPWWARTRSRLTSSPA